MTQRRLALALLGAAFGLVVVATPASAPPAPSTGAPHAALAAGHLVEGLLGVEHPRILGHVLPAVAAHAATLPSAPARTTVTRPSAAPGPAVVTPPAAIRGPPA